MNDPTLQFLSREGLREAYLDASRKLTFVKNSIKNIPEEHIPFNRLREIDYLERRIQEYKTETTRRLSTNIPMRIFYSYSQRDRTLVTELDEKLSDLQNNGVIETFWDREISSGSNWHSKIVEELTASDIVLLMVSSNFLESAYCKEVELPISLEMHGYGLMRIIPIILNQCKWRETLLGAFQATPRNCQPVTEWNDRNKAWADVVQNISEAIEQIQTMKLVS